MKQEEKTLMTKRALAAALKKKMTVKPVSKITVSELIKDCNLNRKTFYYHFDDIYSLLAWMLEEEAFEVVKQFDLLADYEDATAFVMDYVEQNKHILNCAINSMGREGLKRFLCTDFYNIINNAVEECEKRLNIKVNQSFKDFYTVMLGESLVGTLVEWIQMKDTEEKRNEALRYVSLVLKYTVPNVLKAAAENL